MVADYTAQLHKAYALLNAARVALYPIDPRGVFVDSPSHEQDSRAMTALIRIPPPQSMQAQQAAAVGSRLAIDQGSLAEMAEATGGTAYSNRNDLDSALGEAIATGSDYYSLSYEPPVSGYDGRFHTISVKVSRPNLLLEYRKGYTSLDPAKIPSSPGDKAAGRAETARDSFQGTMSHGTVNSTQLQFDVHVTPSSAARNPGDPQIIGSVSRSLEGKHLVRYDFVYDFTGDQITLVDNANGSKNGSVEFVLAAYDSDGKLLNTVGQVSRFTVTPDNVPGFTKRQIQMPVQFDLPAGNVFVRVGMKDVPSEKTGTLEIAESIAGK